ncbi:MAG: hypothetical protein RhofKO_15520 [Rhodothermales bacterium]
MTYFDLKSNIDGLLELTGPQSTLVKFLFIITRGFERITVSMTESLFMQSRTIHSRNQVDLRDDLLSLRKQADSFPIGRIFHEVHDLRQRIDTIQQSLDDDRFEVLGSLREELTYFYSSYETFMRGTNPDDFSMVLLRGRLVYEHIASMRRTLRTLRNFFDLKPKVRGSERSFSLIADYEGPYALLSDKLKALQTAYDELCVLMSIGPSAFPLRLQKMEAPPLWICAVGHGNVTGVLLSTLERFADHWFRHFTGSGNTVLPSDRVINTQMLIDLASELERRSYHQIAQDQAQLKVTALSLIKCYLTFLTAVPELTLNDTKIAVRADARQQYLDESLAIQDEFQHLLLPAQPTALPKAA